MSTDQPKDIISAIGGSVTDPGFYPALVTFLGHRPVAAGNREEQLRQLLLDDYSDLSLALEQSQIQESCTVRNVLRTRSLALLLIQENGELDLELLERTESFLLSSLYALGPKRQHDALRQRKILSVVQKLRQDKELRQLLRLISKPMNHRLAEQVIRDTLSMSPDSSVTDVEAKRAVLSALLCYLRQNVGSCFGTAPAIIIHDEQPHLFLKDLGELLATGRLRRTYGGVEYAVPLSATWGAGDLRRRFLLYKRPDTELPSPVLQSPGLFAALRTIGLAEDAAAAQRILTHTARDLLGDRPYIVSSAEELLRVLLMRHYKISQADVSEYEQRPKPMMQSGLVAHIPSGSSSAGSGGVGVRSARFLLDLEIAYSGFKSLTENALLRSWEYTIASFSEIKADFAKWNLYSSLGLQADQPGGIGAQLYAMIQNKLNIANAKVQEYQDEYEQVFGQVKYLEGRLRSASTEQEIRWFRAEYETKRNEFYTFEEMREKANLKAKRYANLFSVLIETYLRLFPDYFQEVYDADLHDVDVGPYDDSPAGFRLLFKHGRTNTALWTLIKNRTQFVEALASFFVLSETHIAAMPEIEGLDQDLGELITSIVTHIKSDAFMLSALHRMAEAHRSYLVKNPLNNIEKIEKKPWAYTSGGTMDTLVSCYYRREDKPTEVGRWVENEIELLVFLIDTVRKIPQKLLDEYLEDPAHSLLIHSPTHAFLLKPGYPSFCTGVRDNTYTYIWVRDQVVQPLQRFVESLYVDQEMMQILLQQLALQVPPDFREAFRTLFAAVPGKMKATEFRSYVMQELNRHQALQWQGMTVLTEDQLDSLFYRTLPMSHAFQVRTRVEKILETIPNVTTSILDRLMQHYDLLVPTSLARPMPADQLQDIAKVLLCLERRSIRSPQDDYLLVSRAAQALGFAMPAPILFADTNWVTDYFGFTVSPGTGRFELWRFDYAGATGTPMNSWKEWLDGSRRDRTWGIYLRPNEYRM